MKPITKNIGKVGLNPRDEYKSTEQYFRLDIVYKNEKTYIAKADVPIGTDVTNTDYWMTMASGSKGDKGDAFTYDDFTPEQIEELQRPALEAIGVIDNKLDAINGEII